MNKFDYQKSWKKYIDKLLFVFASLYLMTTLGWLWKEKQQANTQNLQKNPTISTKTLEENKLSPTQAFDANKTNNNQPKELVLSIPLPEVEEIANTSIPASISNLEALSSPTIQNSSISNLESSSPQISSSANVNNIPLPPLPPLPPPNIVQQNPQPIVSPISPKPKPKQIVSSPKTLAKVPTINSLNNSSTQKQTSNSNTVKTNQVAVESTNKIVTTIENLEYKYSLVGVVQLPDNGSFALVKINDLTEKIPVGTEIGTSGWVLMAINGNQAVISRENKSVNIRVGETF
jgi:hypothetical protein